MQAALDFLGRKLQNARLEFVAADGRRWVLGRGEPHALVQIDSGKILKRILRNPVLALGETYMEGAWRPQDDDLLRVLEVGIRMLRQWEPTGATRLLHVLHGWWTELNNAADARRNIHHHYDLQPEFYASFLDAGLFYSCAYFAEGIDTLESAQQAKCRHIAHKLAITPGARVLDIGCGFGGMALYLAQEHGAQVTGITLADEQLRVAQKRARELGLEDRVEFRLEDYRDTQGSFDAIASVGMFEHVGRPQYATYFRHVRQLLKPGGVALIHTIGRSSPPGETNPWIRKYIFPGGYIPAASEMLPAIEHAGLVLTDLEVWREHYARTLAHWHQRFQAVSARWAGHYGERFCRMWRYYLQASEANFRSGDLVVFHAQLAHRPVGLPLTRDYLYPRG